MPNWTDSMQQTFEYYIVDPKTWKDIKKVNNVKSSDISWDLDAETLGSASYNIEDSVGEVYIRTYLITIQNGVTEKHPLGTFLVQTPRETFDGRTKQITMDAYSPLLELKEKKPDIGYFVEKGSNIMEKVYNILNNKDIVRAPVIEPNSDKVLYEDFVADIDESYLDFLTELMNNADHYFMLDEMGNILFAPKQETDALQPVWTFDDSNSSILYPNIDDDQDLYGIPNVVEVVYSTGSGVTYIVQAENNDADSPTSIQNRGRKILYRDTEPSITISDSNVEDLTAYLEDYAKKLLKELSTLERTISYKHAYCPVRIGDCVRINYTRAGLVNIKAKVISQTISCEPGCPVTETAVYTTKYWR